MTGKQCEAALEAVLFASGEPVPVERLQNVLGLKTDELDVQLDRLGLRLAGEESGIELVRLADCVQLCSKSAYLEPIREALELRRNTPLSQAALEVLAVVAYNQPVTRPFIEQVRGVDCSGVIASLSARGLIEERGRLDLPGRPLLYGTTANFLRCFSLQSLEDLPPLPDTVPEEDAVTADSAVHGE